MKLRIVAQGFRLARDGESFDFCENSKSNHERENLKSEAMSKTPEFCIRPRPFDKGVSVLFSASYSASGSGEEMSSLWHQRVLRRPFSSSLNRPLSQSHQGFPVIWGARIRTWDSWNQNPTFAFLEVVETTSILLKPLCFRRQPTPGNIPVSPGLCGVSWHHSGITAANFERSL
jgi:hypothetical protein